MAKYKRLLLWDIDGTLVNVDGAGSRSFDAAMLSAFGVEGKLASIEYGGRTDRYLTERMFELCGVAWSGENLGLFKEHFVKCLEAELGRGTNHIHTGVEALLKRAKGSGYMIQGLLTGNFAESARLKMDRFALWHYFSCGAFGEESAERNDLGPVALRKAAEVHGQEFRPDEVFVIGDTTRDVECGKAMGARTIAVATGFHRYEQLAEAEPTAVLRDLSDTDAVWEIIEKD